jgi:uncharacterized UBP type Zn finger protein
MIGSRLFHFTNTGKLGRDLMLEALPETCVWAQGIDESEPTVAVRERWKRGAMPRCEHFEGIEFLPVPERISGCEDCLKTGDTWVHLRMCLHCGYIGCCDSSPNRHARKHHREHNHPLIRSAEPGESWGYCYIHDVSTRID